MRRPELRERAIRAVSGEAEEAEKQGWHTGLCWLCKTPDLLVIWTGSHRTPHGEVDTYACDPCTRWWAQTTWETVLERDFADLTAR